MAFELQSRHSGFRTKKIIQLYNMSNNATGYPVPIPKSIPVLFEESMDYLVKYGYGEGIPVTPTAPSLLRHRPQKSQSHKMFRRCWTRWRQSLKQQEAVFAAITRALLQFHHRHLSCAFEAVLRCGEQRLWKGGVLVAEIAGAVVMASPTSTLQAPTSSPMSPVTTTVPFSQRGASSSSASDRRRQLGIVVGARAGAGDSAPSWHSGQRRPPSCPPVATVMTGQKIRCHRSGRDLSHAEISRRTASRNRHTHTHLDIHRDG